MVNYLQNQVTKLTNDFWCPNCRKRICKINFKKFKLSNHVFECRNCGIKIIPVAKPNSS